MTNSIRIIYLYIVAFITLGMIVGGISLAVNSITSYYYPDSYIFFENEIYDKEDYVYDYQDKREENVRKENYKSERIKDAIVAGAVVIVGAVMYKYHWGIIEKERIK